MTIGTINLTPSETSAFNAVWSMFKGLDRKLQEALVEKISETRTHSVDIAASAKSESKSQTKVQNSHKYYISPEVRALEHGFKCPDDISDDYKKEWHDHLAEKYL